MSTADVSAALISWREDDGAVAGVALVVESIATAKSHSDFLERHFEEHAGAIKLSVRTVKNERQFEYVVPARSGDFFVKAVGISDELISHLVSAFETQRYVFVVCCTCVSGELEPIADGGFAVVSQMRIDDELLVCPPNGFWPQKFTILD